MSNCTGCYWENNCKFKDEDCSFYTPDDNFEVVDYVEDMAYRLWDYQQFVEESYN